jgi:hypothetical protein
MWAYDPGLTKYASNNVLGVQFTQRVWAICNALEKEPSCVEEILPHGFRSKTSLLRQVLRKPKLQFVQGTRLILGNGRPNYRGLPQMFQQGPQSSVITSPLAIVLPSVPKELPDSLLAEFSYCHPALSHPLVEIS